MNIQFSPESSAFTPSDYEICVEGRLGSQTSAWFEDMRVTVNEDRSPPQTIIRGYLVDQAALYGLISRARDLGLTLLSVKRMDEEEDAEPQLLKGDASDPGEDSVSTENF
jgi:hypothetical protein